MTKLLRREESLGSREDEIADAVERLSRSGVGAIIAIEREVSLDEYLESGSSLEARLTTDLLATIFTPYSPLHDGAVIVRGHQIVGAGCILPLSQGSVSSRSMGTRHRAALGLAEETDALVIVVSEETATISVAEGGELRSGLTPMQIRDLVLGNPVRVSSVWVIARASGACPRGLVEPHGVADTGASARVKLPSAVVAAGVTTMVLLTAYLATAAPDLTFWDASELTAAAHTLGFRIRPVHRSGYCSAGWRCWRFSR